MNRAQTTGKRVLLALHPSDELEDALDHAAALAAELQSELAGLFLEDQALFDLCEIAAVEVSRATGALRPLEAASLERQLRAAAEAARARLERLATERRIAWSFEVRRGRFGEAVSAAAQGATLVVARRGALGGVIGRGARPTGPVAVLLEGGPGEAATLDAAAKAARRTGARLIGVLIGGRRQDEAALIEQARRAGAAFEFRAAESDPEDVARTIAEIAPRLLAMDAQGDAAQRGLASRYVAAAASDAILVGPA